MRYISNIGFAKKNQMKTMDNRMIFKTSKFLKLVYLLGAPKSIK